MSMQQQIMLELFDRYYSRGMDAHREGKTQQARRAFLQAAELLFKLAKNSTGQLRKSRIERAEKLVEMAKGIKAPAVGSDPSKSGRQTPQAAESQDATKQWTTADVPEISFDDIAGLADVKAAIRKRIIYPFTHPEVSARYGKAAGGGVMLYGPPGTGKTMIAKAIANEVSAAFFSVRCSDILTKWVGEAEGNIKSLFDAAGEHERAVIFFDESEALFARRGGNSTVMNRVVPEFLAQIDGVTGRHGGLLLLGATNRPWDIDDAAMRPGRFGEVLYVPLPDDEARRAIILLQTRDLPLGEDYNIEILTSKTAGYSGADCVSLCQAASDAPYQREIETSQLQVLEMADFEHAFAKFRPSVPAKLLVKYEKFNA